MEEQTLFIILEWGTDVWADVVAVLLSILEFYSTPFLYILPSTFLWLSRFLEFYSTPGLFILTST